MVFAVVEDDGRRNHIRRSSTPTWSLMRRSGPFSMTTGYAERLGLTLEQGASSSETKADVRRYLAASGW